MPLCFDGGHFKGSGVPAGILGEDGTLAKGGGDLVAGVTLSDLIQDALRLGVLTLFEKGSSIAQPVIIGGFRKGHQDRVS